MHINNFDVSMAYIKCFYNKLSNQIQLLFANKGENVISGIRIQGIVLF